MVIYENTSSYLIPHIIQQLIKHFKISDNQVQRHSVENGSVK